MSDIQQSPDNDSADVLKTSRRSWIMPVSIAGVYGSFIMSQAFAAMVFVAYASSVYGWGEERISHSFTTTVGMFVYLLIYQLIMFGIIYGLLRVVGWNFRAIGLVAPKFKHFLLGLLATVPYYLLLVLVLATLSELIPSLDVNQRQDVGFNNVVSSLDLALVFIGLVIIAPIVEEVAIRGFLYSGVRQLFPKIWAALTVSVVFASLHLMGGEGRSVIWIAAIDTFVLSMLLVWLREKTGNLWAGITLHAAKNFVAFLTLYIFQVS